MKNRTLFLCAACLAVTALSLAGCSSQKPEDNPGRTVTNANTEQEEIARIQNDPKMPPQAKAAAIQSLKDGQRAAQQAQTLRQ